MSTLDTALKFIGENWLGMLVMFLSLCCVFLLLRAFCWLFCWGRYKGDLQRLEKGERDNGIGYVLADLLVKIVNDFRHLLALMVVTIFALALAYALVIAGGSIEEITRALQAVTATLGGLVGSIIGYYFGESAAKKAPNSPAAEPLPPAGPIVEDPMATVNPPIAPAPTIEELRAATAAGANATPKTPPPAGD